MKTISWQDDKGVSWQDDKMILAFQQRRHIFFIGIFVFLFQNKKHLKPSHV